LVNVVPRPKTSNVYTQAPHVREQSERALPAHPLSRHTDTERLAAVPSGDMDVSEHAPAGRAHEAMETGERAKEGRSASRHGDRLPEHPPLGGSTEDVEMGGMGNEGQLVSRDRDRSPERPAKKETKPKSSGKKSVQPEPEKPRTRRQAQLETEKTKKSTSTDAEPNPPGKDKSKGGKKRGKTANDPKATGSKGGSKRTPKQPKSDKIVEESSEEE
jgi:hypothetical protein